MTSTSLHRTARRTLLNVACMLTVCGVAGATTAPAVAQPDMSNVTLIFAQASPNGPKPRLEASGQMKDLPYKIEWVDIPDVIQAFRGNSIDVAYSSDTGAIFSLASNQHPNFSVVMALPMTETYPLDGAVVVGRNSGVKSLADLKGRKVAVSPGTGAQFMLAQWLEKSGLKYADIQPVNLSSADALAALDSGQVDAWAAYEPFISVAVVKHGFREISGNVRVNGSISMIYVRKDILNDPAKTAAVADLLVRIRNSQDWMKQNTAAWAKVLARVVNLPMDVAESAAPRAIRDVVPVDATLIKKSQAQADLFARLNVLPRPVDVSLLFDDRFNGVVAGH
jgi:sulfonate transport system substrate-binding protein